MAFGTMVTIFATWGLQAMGVSLGPLPTALLALPVGILVTVAVLLLTDRAVYRHYRHIKAKPITFLMASIGVMFMMNGLIRFVIGPDDRAFSDGQRFIFNAREFKQMTGLGEGLALRSSQVLTVVVAVVLVAALFWFLQRTKTGKAMRAYSDNEDLALLSGIDPERVVRITWIIAGALATIAGVLYGLDKSFKPFTYFQLLLPMFAAAIVGGLGSPLGAIAGGFIIAFSEVVVTYAYRKVGLYLLPEAWQPKGLLQLLSTDYKFAVSFVILVVVLLVRPHRPLQRQGGGMSNAPRALLAFTVMAGLLVAVGQLQSWSVALQLLNLCLISAVMALGLNIQWGYAGLFNVGVMGFAALGGVAAVLIAKPPVPEAWRAGGVSLALALLCLAAAAAAAVFVFRRLRGSRWRGAATALVVVAGYAAMRQFYDPATDAIEAVEPAKTGYLGGLGLPILLSWAVGGVFAAGAAWLIGKVALGLRADYLAIATLGIAEIVVAILKNEDWLSGASRTSPACPGQSPTRSIFRRAPGSSRGSNASRRTSSTGSPARRGATPCKPSWSSIRAFS